MTLTPNTTYRDSGYSVGDIVPDHVRAEFDKLAEKNRLFDRPDLKLKEVCALADQATDNYRRAHGLSGPEIFQSNIRVWRGPDNERVAPDAIKVALRSDTLATFLAATKEINAGQAGPLPVKSVLTTGNLLQWAINEKTPAQLVWDYNTYQKPSTEPPQERVLRLSSRSIEAIMDGHDRLAKAGKTGITGEQLISASLSTYTTESLVSAYDKHLSSQREWNPKRFGLEAKILQATREQDTAAVATELTDHKIPLVPTPLPISKSEIKRIAADRLDALGTPDQVTAQFRDYKSGKGDRVVYLGTLTDADLIERIKGTEAKIIETLPTKARKEKAENKLTMYLDALPRSSLIEEAILSDLRLDHFSAAQTVEAARETAKPAEYPQQMGKSKAKKEKEKTKTFADQIKESVRKKMKAAAQRAGLSDLSKTKEGEGLER